MAEKDKKDVPVEEQALPVAPTYLDTREFSGKEEDDAAYKEEIERQKEEEENSNVGLIEDDIIEADQILAQEVDDKLAAVEGDITDTVEDDVAEDTVAAEKASGSTQTRRRGMSNNQRRARRRRLAELNSDREIIPVGQTLEAYTPQQEKREAIAELNASASNGMILTGTIMGVEDMENFGEPCAKVLRAGCAILIPATQLLTPETMPKGISKVPAERARQLRALIERRAGAEIDYIIRQVSDDGKFAVASRLDAMAIKRAAFYWRRDRTGNYRVREGMKVECRVQYANDNGVMIEVWGVDSFIRASECSWRRIIPRNVFGSGEKIVASIKSIARNEPAGERRTIRTEFSIKDAYPNPNEQFYEQFKEGQRYRAVVTWVDDKGVFVMMGDYKHGEAVQAKCIMQKTTRALPEVGEELDVVCRQKYEDRHFITCQIVSRWTFANDRPKKKW